MWDEERAQLALQVLNHKVAGIYRKTLMATTFVIVPLIDQRVVLNEVGVNVVIREVLGDCNHHTGVIRLVNTDGWQATAIHELVHRYNPGRTERWVRKASQDVARLLNQGALWPVSGC